MTVVLGGAPRVVVTRVPTVGETHAFVRDPSLHRDEETRVLAARLQVHDAVVSVDGVAMTFDDTAGLVTDEGDRATLLRLRNASVAEAMGTGLVSARCGHCPGGHWHGSLDELAEILAVSRRPLADDSGELAPFALSYAEGVPHADHDRPVVGFVLPGGEVGALVELDDLDELSAWMEWAPLGADPAEGEEDRTFESAGFRAVLRLACALRYLGGSLEITVDDVERLSLASFGFLDELYRLVFLLGDVARVRCQDCGSEIEVGRSPG